MAKVAAIQTALAGGALMLNQPDSRRRGDDSSDIGRCVPVDEAAERLHLTPQYLYEMIRQRRFPSVRCGKPIRVRESDIPAWIEQHRQGAVDEAKYVTYNTKRDRGGTPAYQKADGAYASRLRGPRRRS